MTPAKPVGAARTPPPPDPIADPVNSVSAWNIANALTLLRLALVPVFVVVLFHGDGHDTAWRFAAWAVFAVASVTDSLDGDLARRRGLITDFGKLADPIADKALVGAALVGLSLLGDLPWWVTVVILVREVGVTALRFWVIRHGVIPASRGGKVKTMLQAVAIGLFVLPPWGWLQAIAWVFMIAAIVAALVTAADYVRRALVLRRGSLAHGPAELAAGVHAGLRERGATVAVAESLTGGLLCAALTGTPGASATMRGGLVVYATDSKHLLAGVDAALLEERGPVDPDVALALASGARERFRSTYGLGVTGVAGPQEQDGKPVGLVYAACAGAEGATVREYRFAGSRPEIRAAAVSSCLELLGFALGMPK